MQVQQNNSSPFFSQSLQNLINIIDKHFKRNQYSEIEIDTLEYYKYQSKLIKSVELLVAINDNGISYTDYKNDMQVLDLFNNELDKIINNMVNSGELIIPKSSKGYVKLKDTTKKGSTAMYEAGDYILETIMDKELYDMVENITHKYGFIRNYILTIISTKKSFLDKRHRIIKNDVFGDFVEDPIIRMPEYNQILKKYYYLKFNGKL